MEAHYIIAGFSDIKSELRIKAHITKPLEQLELWFTCEENVLYVHDYDDHKKCIAIAIYNPAYNSWQFFLKNGSYGERLIMDSCKSIPINSLTQEIHKLYKLYGFILFRRI